MINSDGSLSAVSGAPLNISGYPLFLVSDLVANPALDFLYASDPSGNVKFFAIDSATGIPSLTPTTDTVVNPAGATATPDGRYYYQALPNTAQVAGYFTNAVTGALSPVPGNPLSLGLNQVPINVAVDPAGKFLYISNGFSQVGSGGSLYAYSIDAVSGALTAVPGSPFGISEGSQHSSAVDGSGKFLIVSLEDQPSLGILSINRDTGALSAVPGSPPLLIAVAVVADPSGPFVYVGGYDGVGVIAYSIDQGSGALTQTGQVAVPGAVGAIALTH
jgi:6-phosphogluconolactonase (cycloisomerase 2 family)